MWLWMRHCECWLRRIPPQCAWDDHWFYCLTEWVSVCFCISFSSDIVFILCFFMCSRRELFLDIWIAGNRTATSKCLIVSLCECPHSEESERGEMLPVRKPIWNVTVHIWIENLFGKGKSGRVRREGVVGPFFGNEKFEQWRARLVIVGFIISQWLLFCLNSSACQTILL